MQGISSRVAAFGGFENKRKFNDATELEDNEFSDGSGLELYATDFRSFDAQIGRFHQIDLLTELNVDYTGYVFANNNPTLYYDPFGLDTLKRNADGTMPSARPDGSKIERC
jgi:RHS repeat-associated protein